MTLITNVFDPGGFRNYMNSAEGVAVVHRVLTSGTPYTGLTWRFRIYESPCRFICDRSESIRLRRRQVFASGHSVRHMRWIKPVPVVKRGHLDMRLFDRPRTFTAAEVEALDAQQQAEE